MSPGRSPQLIRFLVVRRAIGGLGAALPVVLWAGGELLFGTGIQDSISAYVHTGMGDVFVGMLCAIAAFLLTYRGYPREPGEWISDRGLGIVACLSCLGVALLPAAPAEDASRVQELVGRAHLTSAGIFLASLAAFALCLFTKSDPEKPMTPRKRQRNRVYRTCGWTIVAALALLVLLVAWKGLAEEWNAWHPVFWLESIAVFSFGVSWLVKGEALLGDKR